jgi:excinuclease ABC subunit C
MSSQPQIAARQRMELLRKPAERRSTEEFLESFELAKVPATPGCYIMRDEKDRILYVGKAKHLRSRVRSYINESDSRYMVKFLMRRVAQIEFLLTTTEKEAFLLENNLIKEHRPRYNVNLKDDKTYVSLCINLPHEFPRITVTRKFRKDGSKYFGPYSSAGAVRETIKQIQRLFPLRLCSDSVLRNRTRPCLYYQMNQCSAPCVGYIDRDEYRKLVNQVVMVLEGRNAELEKELLETIEAHANNLEFEKAAEIRDRVYALRATLERQRTVRAHPEGDQDVFGVYIQGRFSEIQVLFIRGGKMTGGRSFSFNQRETAIEEVLSSFLVQYYSDAAIVPSEILVPVEIEDADVLAEILSDQRGGKVSFHHPQRGEKKALVEMADRNAKNNFEDKRLTERANRDLVNQLKEKLRLEKEPHRIECFDISTIQGNEAVGSMVTFEGGVAAKSRYRRYSIKNVGGQDDFAMMREVLLRRFKRAIEESDLPDLVLIDGGKGQLNVATTVFKDLGIEDLEAVGIAKSRALGEGSHSPERFFLPGRKDPIILQQNSPVVLFLARIRDEAHRFAITYHRKRRSKKTLSTTLTSIPGVGPRRARILLTTLGSLTKVRSATVEEIAAVPGFSHALAAVVKEHLGPSSGGVELEEGS